MGRGLNSAIPPVGPNPEVAKLEIRMDARPLGHDPVTLLRAYAKPLEWTISLCERRFGRPRRQGTRSDTAHNAQMTCCPQKRPRSRHRATVPFKYLWPSGDGTQISQCRCRRRWDLPLKTEVISCNGMASSIVSPRCWRPEARARVMLGCRCRIVVTPRIYSLQKKAPQLCVVLVREIALGLGLGIIASLCCRRHDQIVNLHRHCHGQA